MTEDVDDGVKRLRKLAADLAGASDSNAAPDEGLKLLKAFLKITDADSRRSLIDFAEWLASKNNTSNIPK
jgi:hypothetical protein